MFALGHWCKGTPSASRQEEGAARASSPGAQRLGAEGPAEGGLAPGAPGARLQGEVSSSPFVAPPESERFRRTGQADQRDTGYALSDLVI